MSTISDLNPLTKSSIKNVTRYLIRSPLRSQIPTATNGSVGTFFSPVDDDALDGRDKAWIKSPDETVSLVGLDDAIFESGELPLVSGFSNVCAQPGTRKVQRIDHQEAGCASSAAYG